MTKTIQLIAATTVDTGATALNFVELANDAEPGTLNLQGLDRIDLHFPKFTDGRAYSQAYLLRRRLGFTGDIRATGDVLVDQLLQMQRSGFSSAVLREDQNLSHAHRQLACFANFYQGDAHQATPAFAAEEVNA